MARTKHEFRDPIHTFIGASDDERLLIDSESAQRLRLIHQLAMTFLVYPGATHRRFEHSLGVMELAGRVYDVVTDRRNIGHAPRSFTDLLADEPVDSHWRSTLRAAALCHDFGHLPFSHAAEKELLPVGVSHEDLTAKLILDPGVRDILETKSRVPLRGQEVAKLAVGQKHFPDNLDVVESVLSEIITGDAFGVDRIDYLLRDSYHAGVAYGRFDHYRLIDTLRILYRPGEDTDREPQLGIEEGGLQSAEALAMARYFMYSQVYFHRVRRIFDIHLKDFLKAYLSVNGTGHFPTDVPGHLSFTDAEITVELRRAATDVNAPGHDPAKRIVRREPYKVLWERRTDEVRVNPNIGDVIHRHASDKFGSDAIRRDTYYPSSPFVDFPVLRRDGAVVSAREISTVLSGLPVTAFDYIFVQPELAESAGKWLASNLKNLLTQVPDEGAE